MTSRPREHDVTVVKCGFRGETKPHPPPPYNPPKPRQGERCRGRCLRRWIEPGPRGVGGVCVVSGVEGGGSSRDLGGVCVSWAVSRTVMTP